MVSDIITGLTYQHDFMFCLAFWFCFIGWQRFMIKAIEQFFTETEEQTRTLNANSQTIRNVAKNSKIIGLF